MIPGEDPGEKAVVKCEPLNEVARNDTYCVSNYLDNKYRPRPVHDIVHSAKMRVGQPWKYNVVSSNCEHFVTKLRNGQPICKQVRALGDDSLWSSVSRKTGAAVGKCQRGPPDISYTLRDQALNLLTVPRAKGTLHNVNSLL